MTGPITHGGGLARARALHGGAVEDWLDLSTGINPCPPPLPAIPASAWQRLPDADLVARAREAASAFYGTGDTLPLAVPGTQAVIQHLPDLAAKDRTVAILAPTYGEYERVFRMAGRTVELVEDLDWIRPAHGIAVVVNPDNPTGRIFAPATLLRLADQMAEYGGRLVVDEAFADCTPETSVAAVAGSHPGLIVFRSFGKVFGYAGLRLGFVVAEGSVLARWEQALGPWAVSGPALSIAETLMGGDTAALRRTIAERKAGLDRTLASAGARTVGGTALFSLIDVDDASRLHASLCKRNILTRAFDTAPRWLRIGLAPDAASDTRLAEALREAMT